jgi:hypothetical protein
MGVPHGHADVPMPQQFFDRGQIHPGHHQATCKRMSEIMKREAHNLRLAHRPLKGGTEGAIGRPIAIAKDLIILAISELNRFQGVRQ